MISCYAETNVFSQWHRAVLNSFLKDVLGLKQRFTYEDFANKFSKLGKSAHSAVQKL